ncbi:autotransporter strand-loop-strand O-heptosyltransferase [Selenomonas ruminantium]|uniref:autotransporter strand-loop-strand O-heptosyltransferase n=1 Tax=Selenomonas ruminantium TaxID=971 RepID=UPI00042671C4|nr:autotransporter strand-loop-strand O-heptosyltransferase [Selenomonas ruminantium]
MRKHYFRCSHTQSWESTEIEAIQKKLFMEMENFVGDIRGETDIPGLRIDFNVGLRMDIPEGDFHVRISNADSLEIYFEDNLSAVRLVSLEKYAIPWQIDVWETGKHIFSHTFNPLGQNIVFHCSSQAIGDTLAFLPYARLYRKTYNCQVYCWVDKSLKEFISFLYPDIPQVTSIDDDVYAAYYLGTWTAGPYGAPFNGYLYPLWMAAGPLVGLNGLAPKVFKTFNTPPPIKEPYICIGVQASTPRKGWLYPNGWNILVHELKKKGYRVLCIDRHTLTRADDIEIICPQEAEDLTGDIPLMERAKLLSHAQCFIGLSSGLAWVAEAVGCPVVIISGITEEFYEFPTPYRVINRLVCHGCFNDSKINFMHDDICPYHHGTERELECSKNITPAAVLSVVNKAANHQHTPYAG